MVESLSTPLLDLVDNPEQLRQLSVEQLPQLAEELRDFMVCSVEKTGGHLASSLGVVELSIALHYVYQTPEDRLVWDVGHQCYPHKILTGRKNRMDTLRQAGGLCGFTKRDESEFDPFGTGHSSTSISAALGMALAIQKQGCDRDAVAIIGDGALTGGMAFEALNHAGEADANLLVILNDNDMSISENVGGLSRYLGRVLTSSVYSQMRETSKKMMQHLPAPVWDLARRAETHMKGMVVPGTLFEELGFNYFGPIDGHDLPLLVRTLRTLRELKGPRFLHIITQKGRGHLGAEKDPLKYHGIAPPASCAPKADVVQKNATQKTTEAVNQKNTSKLKTPTYTEIFGAWLCQQAKNDPKLIGITPAMMHGSGMVEFAEQFPKQFIDVGIAEQHAVTLAAGLATEGMHPVVAIYSTFLQRSYDQLIHDVALQNLPVLFAIDRAGVVGADGATHAGAFDFSFLRSIPNIVVMTPSDGAMCQQMLSLGLECGQPAAVRYPRANIPENLPKEITDSQDFEDSRLHENSHSNQHRQELELGKGKVVRNGKNLAILSFGALLQTILQVAEELNATVVDMRFVAPLDETLIVEIAKTHAQLVTIEENVIAGGAGSAVNEFLMQKNLCCDSSVLNLGLPNRFVEQGTREEVLAQSGLDADGILGYIKQFFRHK